MYRFKLNFCKKNYLNFAKRKIYIFFDLYTIIKKYFIKKKSIAFSFNEFRRWMELDPRVFQKILSEKQIYCINLDNKFFVPVFVKLFQIHKIKKFNKVFYKTLKYICIVDKREDDLRKIDNLTKKKWKNHINFQYFVNKIFFTIIKPDLVLSFHGYIPFFSTQIHAAKENRIKTILIENTMFKNKFMCTSKTDFESMYSEIIFKIKKKKFIYDNLKSKQHFSPPKKIKDKNYILFLGQIFTDANLIFRLKKWKSPLNILLKLTKWCIKNNYKLIIKLHPKEAKSVDTLNRPYNRLTYNKIKKHKILYNLLLKKQFLIDSKNEYNTTWLIKYSKACVTFNSQSGLEAAMMNKKTIMCGKNYFTDSKYFSLVFNPRDFNQVMQSALEDKKERINNSFLHSIHDHFYDKNFKDISELICSSLKK